MTCFLMSNFNIASMEENFGSRNLFSLSSMVKSNIGLERGGQANLHVITEIILTYFYNVNNNYDLNMKLTYHY